MQEIRDGFELACYVVALADMAAALATAFAGRWCSVLFSINMLFAFLVATAIHDRVI